MSSIIAIPYEVGKLTSLVELNLKATVCGERYQPREEC